MNMSSANAATVEAKTRWYAHLFSQLLSRTSLISSSSSHHESRSQAPLDGDPGNRNHNVHALLLRALPLVAVCAILLVVPIGADSAVHAAAAVLLWF
jgi:hypothetical protein